MAVSCAGYFRSSARRLWRNCRIISGLEALGGYNAGERIVGITTRWIVDGEEERCDVRWAKNLVKGEIDGSGSLKSRFGPSCVCTKCMWAVEGRIRRLLRSKSWQKMACVCDSGAAPVGIPRSESKYSGQS